MPRVLKIDSITHRPICKTAGAGGFSGHNYLCHSKARIGVTGQCKRCTIPFFESGVSIDKMVGCGNAVPCGSNLSGTGWDFDLAFGTGSSYAATQSNDGHGTVANEWASVRFTGPDAERNAVAPFTYKWSTGSTSAGINGLGPAAAGTYSVTVTDKNGKSKTKDMPDIYTRMITVAALETFTTAPTLLTSTNAGVGPGPTFSLDTKGTTGGQPNIAAIIGGKPPLEIRMHAFDWTYGDGGTPKQHADADKKSIRLDLWLQQPLPTPPIYAEGQVGLLHNPANPLKATIHVDGQSQIFEMATANSDVNLWETLDGTLLQEGGQFNPQGAGFTWPEPGSQLFGPDQASAIKWHMSIRDADGKVIRIPTQNKISVAA